MRAARRAAGSVGVRRPHGRVYGRQVASAFQWITTVPPWNVTNGMSSAGRAGDWPLAAAVDDAEPVVDEALHEAVWEVLPAADELATTDDWAWTTPDDPEIVHEHVEAPPG